MSKVVAIEHITLDGVIQAPGRPGEDGRDGFAHGGWAQAGTDEVMARRMGESMGQDGPLLLGRVTYEAMYDFWPKQTDNPFDDGVAPRSFQLVDDVTTTTGVIMATYRQPARG